MRHSGLVSYKAGTHVRRLSDRGATAVEFAGLTVLASLIVLAVMATPVAKTMTTYTGNVVDKILTTGDKVPTANSLASVDTAGAPTKQAALAVQYAMSQLGKPYVWGAEGPNSYDCSGLMMWAYNKAGVQIMRVAADQYASQPKVAKNDLKPGDLVFFNTMAGRQPTHVGMYIGGGKMVVAPSSGDVVKVETLNSYWMTRWWGATRPTG